jgi:hypothetical protein
VSVVVVDLAAFDRFFCQNPASVPTYTGTVRLILNDRDFDLSGPGADAAQMHLVGTVTDQNGRRYTRSNSISTGCAAGFPHQP